jgi:hypothetical protein
MDYRVKLTKYAFRKAKKLLQKNKNISKNLDNCQVPTFLDKI